MQLLVSKIIIILSFGFKTFTILLRRRIVYIESRFGSRYLESPEPSDVETDKKLEFKHELVFNVEIVVHFGDVVEAVECDDPESVSRGTRLGVNRSEIN